MRVCSLFSGGKDSTYALHWAVLKGFDVACLLTLKPQRVDSWMFHYPNIEWTKYQADALGIPQVMYVTNGIKDLELEDLKNALIDIKKEFGIYGIVTGALLSDYQRMMINIVAKEVDLKVYSPLWRKNQVNYLVDLYNHGFRFVLTSISTMGIDPRLLGRVLTISDINDLINSALKYGFNPALEGGEGETFVVDAPLFKKEVVIEDGEVRRIDQYSWVYIIKSVSLRQKYSNKFDNKEIQR
ncbi:MAG: diphthine--ammonia ligase [Vulcanisaeta sp.]